MKKIVIAAVLFGSILGGVYVSLPILKDWFIVNPISDLYITHFRDGAAIDADHVISKLDNGLSIILNRHDQCVCRFVRLTGHWDSRETKVLQQIIRPGFRIVEVGANFGVHTLGMAVLVGQEGKIYAFEANPNVSKYLKQSVALNNFENRIHIYELAAAHKPYQGFMIYGRQNIGGGYILPDGDEAQKTCQTSACTPIRVTTLDQELGHKKIDMLKIDAEGAEPWILEGADALLKNNPALIVMMEWSPSHMKRNNIDVAAFIGKLKHLGFHFWVIDKSASLTPIPPEQLLSSVTYDIVLSRQDGFVV